MARSIDEVLTLLSERAAPDHQEVVNLARDEPDKLLGLVVASAHRLPRSSTAIPAALALIPDEDLGAVSDASVAALHDGAHPSDSQAASLVAHLSLQAPQTLRPHLAALWKLRPNRDAYYAEWPWRGACEGEDIDRLVSLLANVDDDSRRRAWRCLLESRTPSAWHHALASVGTVVPDDDWSRTSLLGVGLEREAAGYRTLFSKPARHIIFPEGFLKPHQWHGVEGRIPDPSWQRGDSIVANARFGGALDVPCGTCSGGLHRLLAMDEHQVALPGPTEVVTCLSCLGWSEHELYFEHRDGRVRPAGGEPARRESEFPADALPKASVTLVDSPPRWRLQDWALSNGRENLNRLGGEPTWIQTPEYPRCPGCQQTMTFFLQLDSLDIEGGPWWLWGSGGIMYAFWCESCALSATLWQCT